MVNIDSLLPAVAIVGIGAFVMIPVNLALSQGVTDENPKGRLPLALIFIAYFGAVITMCIGGGSVTSVVVIAIFLAATWPLTLWRVLCAPRKRRT